MRARTQAGLKAMAIDMGLRPGARVKVEYKALLKDLKWIVRKTESGVVKQINDFIFICEINGQLVSFRYNGLLGDESTKVTLI